jgi:hypothetical protein
MKARTGLVLSFGLLALCSTATSAQIPLGYLSWDVTLPGLAGQFDIVNLTGANASPPDFPITTALHLSGLSLSVSFTGGGSHIYTTSDFTLNPDGLSFDGPSIPIGGTNPLPLSAMLTGMLTPTTSVNVSGLGTTNLDSAFSVALSNGTAPLADGNLAVINAATAAAGGSVPEPQTWMLLGSGVVALLTMRRRGMAEWRKNR